MPEAALAALVAAVMGGGGSTVVWLGLFAAALLVERRALTAALRREDAKRDRTLDDYRDGQRAVAAALDGLRDVLAGVREKL